MIHTEKLSVAPICPLQTLPACGEEGLLTIIVLVEDGPTH